MKLSQFIRHLQEIEKDDPDLIVAVEENGTLYTIAEFSIMKRRAKQEGRRTVIDRQVSTDKPTHLVF